MSLAPARTPKPTEGAKAVTTTITGGDGNRPQPTLEQVAELAGVSRATVSRVVNASPRVSEGARAAVERAIKELGYVPNRAARTLVTRRTNTVALVVPMPPARFFSDPYFAGIVRGVTQVVADSEFQLVLSIPQSNEQNERFERFMLNGHADGAIVVSYPAHDPLLEKLAASGIPTVLSGRPARDLAISYVDADNRGGAKMAVSYLLESGRRHVATIAGPEAMSVGVDRLDGYRDALSEFDVEADPSLIVRGDYSQESGASAMQKLLARNPQLDAVFAASDLMAVGAMRVLAEARRRVPEDVAVLGFDDSPAAVLATPPLSTVRQPMEEMGRAMATMLLDQITSGERTARGDVLTTELILRKSG